MKITTKKDITKQEEKNPGTKKKQAESDKTDKPKKTRKKLYSDMKRIHKDMTVGEFLLRVRKDAWCIVWDWDTLFALEKINTWCKGKHEHLRSAGQQILKDARLPAFIPRTKFSQLEEWRKYPETFIRVVEEIQTKLLGSVDLKNKKDVLKILGQLTKGRVKKIPGDRASLTRRDLAFVVLGSLNDLAYNTVRGLYYELRRNISEAETSPSRRAQMDYLVYKWTQHLLYAQIQAGLVKFTTNGRQP